MSFGQKYNYVIEAKIPEMQKGEMVLVVNRKNGNDTINSTKIRNGMFYMTGHIKKPTMAHLLLKGYNGGFVFVLDNTNYVMTLNKNGTGDIVGGEMQKEFNHYKYIIEEANSDLRNTKNDIENAQKKRHFKTMSKLKKEMEVRRTKTKAKLDSIINRNRDNELGIFLINANLGRASVDLLEATYNSFSKKAKETEQAEIMLSKINRLKRIDVNASAPNFSLHDVNNKLINMHKVNAKIKIIDFWASWCGPCRMENPNMINLYNKFKDKGLQIISVSLDKRDKDWRKALEEDKLPWINLRIPNDWSSDIVKQYNITAIPAIFILDSSNRIIAKQLRGERLKQFISEKLK